MISLILIILVLFLLFGGGYGFYRGNLTPNNPIGILLIVLVVILVIFAFGGPRWGYW